MIEERTCPYCDGSGITIIQTSSLLGLIKKEIPSSCENCGGRGKVYNIATCKFCEGQGLVGNESEICRACNGTGKIDVFSFIPRERLKPGVTFNRRCESCGHNVFEIRSEIESIKLTKSWEREEELRQIEMVERVKVRCTNCNNTYFIPVDEDTHQVLSPQQIAAAENMGMNLSFIYSRD